MGDAGEKAPMRRVLGGRPQTLDDRARPVSPVSIAEFVRAGSSEQETGVRTDLGRWLSKIAPRRKSMKRSSTHAASWIGGAAVVLFILTTGGQPRLVRMLGSYAYFFPPVIIAVFLALNWRARSRLYLAHPPSLVAQGFCGQCGYSLRDLPPAEDNCIICPECGAAWRKERLTWAWWSSPREVSRPAPPSRPFRFVFYPRGSEAPDAAGRLVPAITPSMVQDCAESSQGNDGAHWRSIWAELRPIGRLGRAVTSIVTAATAIVLSLSGALGLWPALTMASIVLGALVSALGVAFAFALWRGDLYMVREDVVRVLTQHELCPSCAQQLTRVVDDEHVVACSHCGSTWLLPAANKS